MMLEGLDLLHDAPWMTLFPGAMLLVVVLTLNVIGDTLRDAADPRFRDV
jgi:peptide/nickel transport system permease protein